MSAPPNISSMAVRLAVRGDHPSSITSLWARLGGVHLAAADLVDEADDMEDDTDGVHGADVVDPTSLARGLGIS